ncbi:MAG TPA: 1-phosphofructokinase [Longimicrobiales bacterium]
MVITLTLNPAVDQTMFLERLTPGEVVRVRETQLDPAGKGINASRVVHRLGWPTIAFAFSAGETGLMVARALDEEGVQHHFVRVDGQTRINITVVEEATGRATSLYGPGPAVSAEQLAALEGLLRFWLPAGRVLVLAGSLPPGAPEDTYAAYIAIARTHGVATILDTSGTPLALGLVARPDVVKPNLSEAEELLGRALPDLEAVVAGAREIASRGIRAVIISMGKAGSVCVEGERAWHIIPPEVERRSTVGSGDSFIAGVAIALARGDDLVDGLRLGTAAGAATATTSGTALGDADEIARLLPRVHIEEIRT